VAEHEEGDPTVAGRRLTPEEEERLIAEAWADRDDDSIVWAKSDVRISPDRTFVLSVRVSRAQVRALATLQPSVISHSRNCSNRPSST